MVDQAEIVRWESPPLPVNGRVLGSGGRPRGSRWDTVALNLMDRPGRWAVIFEGSKDDAKSLVVRVVQGTAMCFRPAGHFQSCSRTVNNIHVVYARYVGAGQRRE